MQEFLYSSSTDKEKTVFLQFLSRVERQYLQSRYSGPICYLKEEVNGMVIYFLT